MPSLRKKPTRPIEIEHHVPGRTRLRLHKAHARAGHGSRVHEELSRLPGVDRVHFNDRTGSMVIEHGDHPEMLNSITGLTGQLATEMLELVVEAEEVEVAEILFLGGILLTGAIDLMRRSIKPPADPGLVHHTHGRTRFKVHEHQANQEYMDHVSSHLKKVKGVRDVTYNHKTGSIVVHHDAAHETLKEVGSVLSELSKDLFETIVKGENGAAAGVHAFAELLSRKDEEGEGNSLHGLVLATGVYLLLFKFNSN